MAKCPSNAKAVRMRRSVIDPIQRTLEVLHLDSGHWVIVAVHADREEVRVEPFEATTLPLARLWVD